MIFLKSLLFIVWNVAIGIGFVLLVRWLLFNQKTRFVFGLHIPLTPGLLVQKRDWVFNKARALLHDYLDQADRLMESYGYLYKWEKMVFDGVMQKARFMDGWFLLPGSWKQKLKESVAKAARDIARKFLRKFVPKMLEQLQVEKRIDGFDEQFSSRVLRQYYNQYVHKYLMYFFIAINILVGITNMILYWIIA